MMNIIPIMTVRWCTHFECMILCVITFDYEAPRSHFEDKMNMLVKFVPKYRLFVAVRYFTITIHNNKTLKALSK